MIIAERYLRKSRFENLSDFRENLELIIPAQFNFGYDVVDEYALQEPEKTALVWTNDKGDFRSFTFAEMKVYSDRTASWFVSLGIGHGDKVMLILKRRYEFWFAAIALHKIGAICIPATHLLKKKDLIFRNNAADIKALITVGEETILQELELALPESPSVEIKVSVGPLSPEGWLNFREGTEKASHFVRPPKGPKMMIFPSFISPPEQRGILKWSRMILFIPSVTLPPRFTGTMLRRTVFT